MRLIDIATCAVLLALGGTPGAAAAGPHGHGHDTAGFSAGEPGDASKPARIVRVTMQERGEKMLFVPERIEVHKGEQIKFVLINSGELEHEFVLATTSENLEHAVAMQRNPEMSHTDVNARRIAPKHTGEIVWKFSKAGEFEFACLIPGHREAGMFGTVDVK